MMFDRILVAVADDEIAGEVIATAKQLGDALGARLALVHAVEIIPPLAPVTPPGTVMTPLGAGVGPLATQEVMEAQQDTGRRVLERARDALGQAELIQRDGPSTSAIIAAAREWAADLIVIGTHGRSGLGRLALGSVAEGVLREAPCPVLTVRLGTAPA